MCSCILVYNLWKKREIVDFAGLLCVGATWLGVGATRLGAARLGCPWLWLGSFYVARLGGGAAWLSLALAWLGIGSAWLSLAWLDGGAARLGGGAARLSVAWLLLCGLIAFSCRACVKFYDFGGYKIS